VISLTNTEENEIEYDGITYKVDISFNNIINLINFCKENITDAEVFYDTFFKIAINEIPELELIGNADKHAELANGIIDNFILMEGEEKKPVELDLKGNLLPKSKTAENETDYDLNYDSDLIYSAFMQAYQMDLIEEQGILSWSKFNALLGGLPDDTRFSQVREIRNRELPKGKGTEAERKSLIKAKKEVALPKKIREEE